MDDLARLKEQARKRAFAARKAAHAAACVGPGGKCDADGADARANRRLAAHLAELPDYRVIAGYMPIRTEISPLAVMEALHASGKIVVVPVIAGKGKPLLFSRWSPECAMIEGPFGAMVPAEADYLRPEVLITPLVAFDRRGYRLGYGGGFYDRSIEMLTLAEEPHAVGLAYAAQELPEVPAGNNDRRLNALVTEREVLRF